MNKIGKIAVWLVLGFICILGLALIIASDPPPSSKQTPYQPRANCKNSPHSRTGRKLNRTLPF